jgi:uncharacterized protein DUF3800
VFEAYLDESETADHRILSVGAYLSETERWGVFQREWQDVLDNAGVQIFHMTDFEARRPPYDSWDNVKRIRVLRRLMRTIRARTRFRASVSVSIPDYEAVAGRIREVYGPYGFCAFQCLQYIARWVDDNDQNEPIAYFFERGSRQGEITRAMEYLQRHADLIEKFRFYSYTFVPKSCQPVQASDILAYETAKHVRNWFAAPPRERRPTRRSLEFLMESSHYGTYYNRARLEEWFRAFDRFEQTGEVEGQSG